MHKLFVVMGKSASGKDTVFRDITQREELSLKTIVGYTTRPIRDGEQDGREYFFVSKEALLTYQDENKVIEHRAYDTMHGVWDYFTLDDGQIDFETGSSIMLGTLESYGQIRRYFGEERVYPIYLEVEDGLRLERALLREKTQKKPKYAELCRRFLADEEDFKEENLKALGIIKRYDNTDRELCLAEILKDIRLNMGI
ncbi:guanylate kinase [Anaerocolumna chitinilytica]|uniref:Guanylate kinase n=1 Tax=Anaerocolumna chitinilytica TaxID=1727145 RepID=A0A7M3SBA0_9FIRM|nr:guanylate kinase [Anaerocolumna chitinilytica]BCK01868.1 guanylate kinase [Anaerocolumna chitinilytica]